MRFASAIYLTLAILGTTAAVLVPLTIYRSGSTALPVWRAAANPGLLSAAHAFLGAQCEACHTPQRGIEAASCLTCHDTDAPVLAKQSTAFHAAIQECRGCHIEHRGAAIRPTNMDHTILARVGWQKALGRHSPASPKSETTAMSEIRHFLAGLTGGHPPSDSEALDCFACHSNRNPHHDGTSAGCCGSGSVGTVGSLFGRECADCHVTTIWKIPGYKHPSPRSQDCAQCHQPPPSHYMGHFEMISKMIAGQMHARVEQCYLCHQTDAWNDIKGVGWYKHH
jgi:Class III cytochrome C family